MAITKYSEVGMWIRLEPEDVLLFRDARPFTAAEDVRAEGVFPPLPSPIAGALRTRIIGDSLPTGSTFADYARKEHAETQILRDRFGDADSMGQMILRGPLVCAYFEDAETLPLFAAPADLLGRFVPEIALTQHSSTFFGGRSPVRGGVTEAQKIQAVLLLPQGAGSEQIGHGPDPLPYLDGDAMTEYLRGASTVHRLSVESSPTDSEGRTGIAVEPESRTAKVRHLYYAEMHRPRLKRDHSGRMLGHGLLIEVLFSRDNVVPDEEYRMLTGFVALGAESRSAYVQPLPDFVLSLDCADLKEELARTIAQNEGLFRLYLATPVVLARGVLPRLFSGIAFPEGWCLQMLTAASGKPVSVAGWDMASRQPRPLCRAVPAGSVWHGQIDLQDSGRSFLEAATLLVEMLHGTTRLQSAEALSDDAHDAANFRAAMGFGMTFVGALVRQREEETDEKGSKGGGDTERA